ncbi:hypothetical protein CB0940_07940 [Cercospora beticola]|uniref:Peptide hydrolase n=2 Tax=Cercospora beticola TaxID=122368 RepID=A0A2G5H8A3_CERBT|nr:hypothetical protein CB0940_07940 [Cercospora beticola]PIA88759.1 hypothetical protein CB0940_07940 [Cercospora beticola]
MQELATMLSLVIGVIAFVACIRSEPLPIRASAPCSPSTSDLVPPTAIDASIFASSCEIKNIVDQICHSGLRLPGSPNHLKVIKYITRQLRSIPGVTFTKSDFELANWQPAHNSIYRAAQLKIGDEAVDVAGAIAYSLPTNGSAISGQLMYLDPNANISTIDLKGKIIVRDYSNLAIPTSLFQSIAYYASADATLNPTYSRPFLTPPHADLLAASLGGAAGYVSAFNVSRKQLEGYYSGHSGTHWLVPGVFTGAEQYLQLREAAEKNLTASIRIDAKSGRVKVPRLMATLPGLSNETIVIATHTDGVTYVQENGPAALLTLLKYFAALPIRARVKTLKFAFEASHLAYQLDSDKLLAKSLDADYDQANGTTAFVIAIEHLGSREIESYPAPNGTYGNVLNYTGRGEAILWAVGEVQQAIDGVIDIAKNRSLDNVVVSPGFPPANPPNMVPTYPSMGGLGTYYTNALLPTMSLISGPWSLWAPSFGAEAVDYDRLRIQHIAIGDAVLMLSQFSKEQLAGNYTEFRRLRAAGTANTTTINYDDAQFITTPDGVYY